ncbi:MAG: cyclic pyranopterin monophosphate synthase MoaC [Deltaproteobacteria bacterium]|nr:cyclic pyranopterin monophosphate synthase MoaC [Deltaproteobacteria bacterium]
MADFTHLDDKGRVRMVDVTEKGYTDRTALARGLVKMKQETFKKIQDHKVKKGNVLETARISGIMAVKKTSELIPMCHPLYVTHISIDFFLNESSNSITIESSVRTIGPTGVEMEALTAVAVSALTIYDMCKSYDKEIKITDILLLEKSGGKSGHYKKAENSDE